MEKKIEIQDLLKIGGAVVSIYLGFTTLMEYLSEKKIEIKEVEYEEVK